MKKTLTILLALVLVIAMSVAGTMAYLTATTATVTNTFTVGNVGFDEGIGDGLDEAKVDAYGVAVTPAERVTGNAYKLIPGHTYTKDPTVHISSTSEDCWLFVKVVNGISAIEATGDTTIAKQMAAKGWTAVEGLTNVYAYNSIVKANADVVVFESFTLSDSADVSGYTDASITIQACAIQADGFNSAAAAAAKLPTTFTGVSA